MSKNLILYLAMIVLPAVLVAVGGARLVQNEVRRIKEDEQILAAGRKARALERAQNDLAPELRKAIDAAKYDEALVRNIFLWTPAQGLVEPSRARATKSQKDFLNRFSGFLTNRQPWVSDPTLPEGWKQTDHGLHGELLFWKRQSDGSVAGCELRTQEVLARHPPEQESARSTRGVYLLGGCLVALLVLTLAAGGAHLLFAIRRVRAESFRKTQVLEKVSHDLRTPLANVRLYGELLKERRLADEKERDAALDTVADESEKIVRLVLDTAYLGVIDLPEGRGKDA